MYYLFFCLKGEKAAKLNVENNKRDIPRIEESFCKAWDEGGGDPEGDKMVLQCSYKA